MHWATVVRAAAFVDLLVGVAMLAPFGVALGYGEPDRAALGIAAGATLLLSGVLVFALRGRRPEIGRREALLVTALGWLAACLLGSLPFLIYGLQHGVAPLDSFTACFFETVSGFTTTGATVIADVESLPHGILLWRAAIQWLGGMGIIVLFVAVLPLVGIGAQELFRAEVPGTTKDKFTPHLRDTARWLWIAYVSLSAAEVLALALAGMGWFDAVCHTCTTMATGGFSTRNAGIVAFDSPAIEGVLIFFMAVAGTNFALHVRLLSARDVRAYPGDVEWRWYVGLLGAITVTLAGALWLDGAHDGPLTSLRHAAFQTVSLMTTTGYHSDDFAAWAAVAPLAPVLLLLTMFVGGCSGSTAGAMKVSRLLVVAKHAWRELARMAHPRGVFPVRLGGRTVPEPVVLVTTAFVLLYVSQLALGIAAVAATGEDLVTAVSAVAATIGNVGPGLGDVGPATNYAGLHPVAHWVLIGEMLLGRLELLTVLALLTRPFWRR